MDYLMSLGDEGFRTFLDMMSGTIPMKGRMVTREEILTHQEKALRVAWDLDPQTFDEKWRRWVLTKYPKR